MEEQNVDGFTEAVKDYDSISRLDQWYTTILLRIKKSDQWKSWSSLKYSYLSRMQPWHQQALSSYKCTTLWLTRSAV